MFVVPDQNPEVTRYICIPELKDGDKKVFPAFNVTELKNADDLGIGHEKEYKERKGLTLSRFMHAYFNVESFRDSLEEIKPYQLEILSTWIEPRDPNKGETIKSGYMPIRLINRPKNYYNHKKMKFDISDYDEFFDLQTPQTGWAVGYDKESGLPLKTKMSENAKRVIDERYNISLQDLLVGRYNQPKILIDEARKTLGHGIFLFDVNGDIGYRPFQLSALFKGDVLLIQTIGCYSYGRMKYRECLPRLKQIRNNSYIFREEKIVRIELSILDKEGKPIVKEWPESAANDYFLNGGKGKIVD